MGENREELVKNLAIYLHDKFCHWNHADGCSWHYAIDRETGKHDWSEFSHREYLKKAFDLLLFVGNPHPEIKE